MSWKDRAEKTALYAVARSLRSIDYHVSAYRKEPVVRDRQLVIASGMRNFGVAMLALALTALAGCKDMGVNSWLDQSEVTRGNKKGRLEVPILNSVDPIDEGSIEFTKATEVRPDDLKVIANDYVIGRNDLVTISIFDLVNAGVESVRTARVSETGMLSLPLLTEPVKAAGLTEPQLQKAIAQKYKDAGLIQNAQVSVTVVEARGRTFNITGSVARPGQYVILEADFRILQALIQAGDTTFPDEYMYVIRKRSAETSAATQPGEETEPSVPRPPATGPSDLAPQAQSLLPHGLMMAMADQPTGNAVPPAAGSEDKIITLEGQQRLLNPSTQPAAPAAETPAATPPGETVVPPTQPAYDFGSQLKMDEDTRIIRIPLQQLKNGDLRYNIVVRPNDTLIVPVPMTGFYYMAGHVASPGAYTLTGMKVTLLQAVASARGLDQFAVPERTDLIRRIGGDKSLYLRVNLKKVAMGEEADIFLKPNDQVWVGTDWYPPFLQALRGAFRATYGFGFLYDRNFAPAQPGINGN
jgi:polysaccharide biosynthesis/export protein